MHEGISAHQKGQLSQAQLSYKRALKLEPGIAGAKTNLGAIAYAKGELEKALKELQGELERRPDDPTATLLRALTFVAMGNPTKAAEDAEPLARLAGGLPAKTVSGKTRRAAARLIVGLARLAGAQAAAPAKRTEAVQAAWDAIEPVLELKIDRIKVRPTDLPLDTLTRLQRDARRVGGVLALAMGKYERGLTLLTQDATAKRPAPYPVLRLHAMLALGRTDEALALVAKAEAGPLRDSPWAKVLRGHALLRKGRTGEVHKIVGGVPDSKDVDPSLRAAALRLLAVAASTEGKWIKVLTAVTRAEKLLGRGQVPASLWLDKATAQAHLGKLEDARRTVAGVLRDDPEDKRARQLEAALK